jgi:aryl-alcohol dehydrogenase-like predicted oxidoreductase
MILYVGVSDWPAWEAARATTLAELRGWSPFVGLELQYNLLERTPERDLLPMAHALGLGVTAWSPLAGGMLTGKYLDGADANGRLSSRARDDSDRRTERVVCTVVAVAEELDATPSQVALAWLLARPSAVIPILGASKEAQLVENLGCLDVALEHEHVRRLDQASAIELGFPHDFLRQESIKQLVYGDRHQLLETQARASRAESPTGAEAGS